MLLQLKYCLKYQSSKFPEKITKFARIYQNQIQMKRPIALLFLLCTFAYNYAQYSDFPVRNFDMTKIDLEKLRFGLKVSPSISWLNIDHNNAVAGGATMKLGLGVTAHYEINELLSIVSGVNYNAIGGYMADSSSFNDLNAKDYFKANYTIIEVPLGIKLNTPVVNRWNYYLQGGVTTGFVLSANEKTYSASNGKVLKTTDTLKNLTYPSIVGYFAGVGSRYNISDKLNFFVEINYKNALTSISNGENYMNDTDHAYNKPIYMIPANMEFSFGLEF